MEQQIQTTELQITQAKQAAEFALTPVGQIVKQFEVMQRMAKMYTESTIVPETYKGNVGNCVIAIDMATRMGVNSLMVMQNLYIVKGNPSWSSKFLIATINMSGKYSSLRYRKRSLGKVGKIKYNETVWDNVAKRNTIVVKEFDGTDVDNIECIAYATELSTGETLESDDIQDVEYEEIKPKNKLADLASKAAVQKKMEEQQPYPAEKAETDSKQPSQKTLL